VKLARRKGCATRRNLDPVPSNALGRPRRAWIETDRPTDGIEESRLGGESPSRRGRDLARVSEPRGGQVPCSGWRGRGPELRSFLMELLARTPPLICADSSTCAHLAYSEPKMRQRKSGGHDSNAPGPGRLIKLSATVARHRGSCSSMTASRVDDPECPLRHGR